ncbi:hypothetical protein [Burkholderia sp. PAMC 26561]|uniref:hypothetical protein n=1 Tax=Burkholderia sp. PAMC 26561 TaxID=1795043 RepID=UPI00076B1AAC|nr:hypothetical protein [Burkholderia sp. PAMC 26561]AME26892.1 hypothetical protein AXG89_23180 [Burkholderia sp. PAMC 26561]AME27962.1 hypothetical protein AXG89_29500 [Burkholderia sp. PAMC 26561]
MLVDRFIAQSNLFSRVKLAKQQSREAQLYASWILSDIQCCLTSIAIIDDAEGEENSGTFAAGGQQRSAFAMPKKTLMDLSKAVCDLQCHAGLAALHLSELGNETIGAHLQRVDDATTEETVVIVELTLQQLTRNLTRVHRSVQALEASVRKTLHTIFSELSGLD